MLVKNKPPITTKLIFFNKKREKMVDFFSYKGYDHFDSQLVHGLRHDLRHRQENDTVFIENHASTVDRAFHRQYTELNVSQTVDQKDVIPALMVWRLISPAPDTTMFVHATVGDQEVLLVHAPTTIWTSVQHVATYMGFFVCMKEGDTVVLLYEHDWHIKLTAASETIHYGQCVLIRGTISIKSLYRSENVGQMSLGYYNSKTHRERNAITDILHDSEMLITRLASQTFIKDASTGHPVEIPFAVDYYTNVKSIQHMQEGSYRICLTTSMEKYHFHVLKKALASFGQKYTPTFQSWLKNITILRDDTVPGKEIRSHMEMTEIARVFFSKNVALVKNFRDSDTNKQVPSYIQKTFYDRHSATKNGRDLDKYLVAAFLVFVVTIQESPTYFVTTNINRWLEELNVTGFIRFLKEKANVLAQGFAYRLFIGYITHGVRNNMALRSWFVNNNTQGGGIDKPNVNLYAPKGNLFSYHEHIIDLAAHIFVILGVRIGAFDTINFELYEKCISACMEAIVITEVLFPRMGYAPLISTTSTEYSVISDSRLWIAAWLLVFKIIVDRNVQSEKITAIMTLIQETTSNKQQTNYEQDILVFKLLFCNDQITPVSYLLGALVPTIGDIRRHSQKTLADLRVLNFTNIFDVTMATLHWKLGDVDISLDDYVPTYISYSNDISACARPTIVLGSHTFDLNQVGSVLRKVFYQFYSNKTKTKTTHAIVQDIAAKEDIYDATEDVPAVITVIVDENEQPLDVRVSKKFDNSARVARVARKFIKKSKFDVNFLDDSEWSLLYWLVSSPIMHQITESGTVAQGTLLNVKKQSDAQPGQDLKMCMYLGSTRGMGMSFCLNSKTLKQYLIVKQSTEAQISDVVASQYWDIPVSYGNNKVLAKTDFMASRYIEGYPLFASYDDPVCCKLYGHYSDCVALSSSSDRLTREVLLNNLANTVQSRYQNTFRLRPEDAEKTVTVEQYIAYLDSLLRFDDTDKYLIRDILSEANTAVRRQLVPKQITQVQHENEAVVAYASGENVQVTTNAIELLGRSKYMTENAVFGETSYGISHFFKFTDYLQTRTGASLLRMLCASKYASQLPHVLSPMEYYAPISGYIYSSLAGKPTLPIEAPDRIYPRINNFKSSRRNIQCAAFSSTGYTGRVPVVDVFDDMTMYQLKLDHDIDAYTVQYDEEQHQHFLEYSEDVDDGVLDTLAGEITQVEIFVHALQPVKKNQQETATESLLAYVREHIFSTEQLYPVDNFTWFQFTSVVSAKSIPSNLIDKLFIEEEEKSSPKNKMQRLGARFPTKDTAYKKHSSFMLRTLFYKSIEHDVHDLNFKRDFVEFYNQYILSQLPNTDDVYLGSIDDYATLVRYYNTMNIEERTQEERDLIDSLHTLSENLLVFPSNVFPNWYVAFLDRRAKYLLIVKPESTGSSVYDRTIYALTKAAEGFVDDVTVQTKTITYDDDNVGFFVMLRIIKTIISRQNSHLAIDFDNEELSSIVNPNNNYSDMIMEVVDFIQNTSSSTNEDDPDREYRYSLAIPLADDEKSRLTKRGTRGYLTDTILTRATAWIHLVYTKENPYPYQIFRIMSSLESTILANATQYKPERQPFNSTLTFFPWFIHENHFFLVFVYLPRKLIIALDSLQMVTPSAMNTIKRAITKIYVPEEADEYRAIIVKNVARQQRGDLYRCGDYTIANIEYLIRWFIDNPIDFDASVDDMLTSHELYTIGQINEINELALSFRERFMEHIKVELPDTTTVPAATSQSNNDDVFVYNPSSPIHVVSDDEFAYEKPVAPNPSDDDVQVIPDQYSTIFDFVDETPVMQTPLQYNTEQQADTVYPSCVVRGYEISAQRFGNSTRYVRYVDDEQNATAAFVRKPRDTSSRADEPQLSYWELKALYSQRRREEVTVALPSGDNWMKLLASGHPFTQKSRALPVNPYRAPESLVGPSFGLPARALPLVSKTSRTESRFAASPLPLCGTRMKTSAK